MDRILTSKRKIGIHTYIEKYDTKLCLSSMANHSGCNSRLYLKKLDNHPLPGKHIFSERYGEYIIQEVSKQWSYGWSISIKICKDGSDSHAFLCWENIDSIDPNIISLIHKAKREFKLEI